MCHQSCCLPQMAITRRYILQLLLSHQERCYWILCCCTCLCISAFFFFFFFFKSDSRTRRRICKRKKEIEPYCLMACWPIDEIYLSRASWWAPEKKLVRVLAISFIRASSCNEICSIFSSFVSAHSTYWSPVLSPRRDIARCWGKMIRNIWQISPEDN